MFNKSLIQFTFITLLMTGLLSSRGVLALQTPSQDKSQEKPEDVLHRLVTAVHQLKDYTVIHVQRERFGEQMGPEWKMKVKVSGNRVYLRMLDGPKKGAEVIYRPNWNDDRVRVHKGSFPDLTLNLDPHGSRMMEDQHHPIEHLSFQHIIGTMVRTAQACRDFPGAGIKTLVEEGEENRSYETLELKAPWKEKQGTVLKDEDIWAFSKRMGADPYLILHANSLTGFNDLEEGMSLKVPLCYATRTLVRVDKKTFLPRKMETYDSKGKLYESYEWQDLDPKTPITDKDFDPDNQEYGF